MKTVTFASLFILFSISTFAQPVNLDWAVQTGGSSTDSGNAITVDASGNVYTTGSFFDTADFDPGAGTLNLTSAGSADVFVCKYDASGNLIWAVNMGGTQLDDGRSIAVDASGNVFITGRFGGTADFDPGAGTFNLTAVASDDVYICKLDNAGDFVWAKQMGGSSFDIGQSIAVDASGNVYSTGYFFDTVDFDPGMGTFNLTAFGSHDIYVSKLDNSGNFIWAKQMGGNNIDFGISLDLDASGNVYTTGHFRGTADFNPGAGVANLASVGDQDIFICKLDASGNFGWVRQMGGTESDGGQAITIDNSGNVFTTGYFSGTADLHAGAATSSYTSAGGSDIFINKLNASGDHIWSKQIGGPQFDEALSVTTDASGNILTAGGFNGTVDFDPGAGTFDLTSNGLLDIFISKLDASGDFVWAIQMGSSKSDDCLSVAVDNAGTVHSTGYFQETVDFDPGTGTFDLTSNGGFDIFVQKLRSVPVSTFEENSFKNVKIYPNPTNGKIILDLGSANAATIRVVAMDGRLIYQNKSDNNIEQIDITEKPGVYILEITSQNTTQAFKLIKH